jgi:hypothetical protein
MSVWCRLQDGTRAGYDVFTVEQVIFRLTPLIYATPLRSGITVSVPPATLADKRFFVSSSPEAMGRAWSPFVSLLTMSASPVRSGCAQKQHQTPICGGGTLV